MAKQEENKNLTRPHLKPNQSKKSIKDKGQTSIYNFVQDHKLHKRILQSMYLKLFIVKRYAISFFPHRLKKT